MDKLILDLWPAFLAVGAGLAAVVKFLLDAHKIRESQLKLQETRLRIRELEGRLTEQESRIIQPSESDIKKYSLPYQRISHGLLFAVAGLLALSFLSFNRVRDSYHERVKELTVENRELISTNRGLLKGNQFSQQLLQSPGAFAIPLSVAPGRPEVVASARLDSVSVTDVTSGQELLAFRASGKVTGIAYNNDGSLLAVAAQGQAIELRDGFTGSLLRHLDEVGAGFESVSFASEDRYLVAASRSQVVIWDIESGEIQQLAEIPSRSAEYLPKVEVRLSSVDDKLIVFLNSHRVVSAVFGQPSQWVDVSAFLNEGVNTLLYFVENNSGPCGGEVLVRIDGLERPDLQWRMVESGRRPAGECLTGRREFEL